MVQVRQQKPAQINRGDRRYGRQLEIDRAIRMIKERVAPEQTVDHGISFHLDTVTLGRIQLAQRRNQSLHIPTDFLGNFRRYVLFDRWGNLQTGVTFITFYRFGDYERPLLKTVISLDGDVIHQIGMDCLRDERLAHELTHAHYWLIRQLFSRIHLGFKNWLDRLAWVGSTMTVGGYWLSQWSAFWAGDPTQKIIELGVLLGGSWVAKLLFQQLLKLVLPWLQRQVMRRLFQQGQTQGSRQGQGLFKWLEWLG